MYTYAHSRINNDKHLLKYLRGTGGVYPQAVSNALDATISTVSKATQMLQKLVACKEDADAEREAMTELDFEMGITRGSDEHRGLRLQSRRHRHSPAFKQEGQLLKQWNDEVCPELGRNIDGLHDACQSAGLPEHIVDIIEYYCYKGLEFARLTDGDVDYGYPLQDRLEFLRWELGDFLKDLMDFPQTNFMQLLVEHLDLSSCNSLKELPLLP